VLQPLPCVLFLLWSHVERCPTGPMATQFFFGGLHPHFATWFSSTQSLRPGDGRPPAPTPWPRRFFLSFPYKRSRNPFNISFVVWCICFLVFPFPSCPRFSELSFFLSSLVSRFPPTFLLFSSYVVGCAFPVSLWPITAYFFFPSRSVLVFLRVLFFFPAPVEKRVVCPRLSHDVSLSFFFSYSGTPAKRSPARGHLGLWGFFFPPLPQNFLPLCFVL